MASSGRGFVPRTLFVIHVNDTSLLSALPPKWDIIQQKRFTFDFNPPHPWQNLGCAPTTNNTTNYCINVKLTWKFFATFCQACFAFLLEVLRSGEVREANFLCFFSFMITKWLNIKQAYSTEKLHPSKEYYEICFNKYDKITFQKVNLNRVLSWSR